MYFGSYKVQSPRYRVLLALGGVIQHHLKFSPLHTLSILEERKGFVVHASTILHFHIGVQNAIFQNPLNHTALLRPLNNNNKTSSSWFIFLKKLLNIADFYKFFN